MHEGASRRVAAAWPGCGRYDAMRTGAILVKLVEEEALCLNVDWRLLDRLTHLLEQRRVEFVGLLTEDPVDAPRTLLLNE